MRRLTVFFLCLFSVAVHAEQQRLSLQTVLSEDSDDARQAGYYLKYRRTLDHPDDNAFVGAGIGTRKISDFAGQRLFKVLSAEYRQPLAAPVTFKASATKLLRSDWSPWSASTALIITPHPRWYIELFAERDIVDTVTAIDLENHVNTYGVSADYRLHDDWTLVGATFRQTFRDGNERTGRVGRLIWEIPAIDWLRAEIKLRRLDSDFNGIGYFSPDELEEDLLLLTASRAFFRDNAVFSAQLGGGEQRINNSFNQSLYVAEFKGRGWFDQNWGMEGRLGCKNTGDANFAATADDYRYCYADLELLYAW